MLRLTMVRGKDFHTSTDSFPLFDLSAVVKELADYAMSRVFFQQPASSKG